MAGFVSRIKVQRRLSRKAENVGDTAQQGGVVAGMAGKGVEESGAIAWLSAGRLVGKVPDAELAAKTTRSRDAVRAKRVRLNRAPARRRKAQEALP